MRFSDRPFKMFTLKDPLSGKVYQLTDRKKAETLSQGIGAALTVSKYWYSWLRSGVRGVRVCTGQDTLRSARKWVKSRNDMAAIGIDPDPLR